jgi:hypothetical protein
LKPITGAGSVNRIKSGWTLRAKADNRGEECACFVIKTGVAIRAMMRPRASRAVYSNLDASRDRAGDSRKMRRRRTADEGGRGFPCLLWNLL